LLEQHPFHLLTESKWPFFTSWSLFLVITSIILIFSSQGRTCFYAKLESYIFAVFSFILFFVSIYSWFSAIVFESRSNYGHSYTTQQSIRLGMILFISSEFMLFFSFFWAYFHICLSPPPEIRCIWPPINIEIIDPWSMPLLNTIILLSSGITITLSHYCLITNLKESTYSGFTSYFLNATLFLGILFTSIQSYEYYYSPFCYSNNIYGSLFFLLTGFHGFHVIIGSLFLFICDVRLIRKHFSCTKHVGFECAIWYWHFVDLVWLFLYCIVYVWGGSLN
jgi:heme/copper-type cytochrome/quinol oxidase subunit 3